MNTGIDIQRVVNSRYLPQISCVLHFAFFYYMASLCNHSKQHLIFMDCRPNETDFLFKYIYWPFVITYLNGRVHR